MGQDQSVSTSAFALGTMGSSPSRGYDVPPTRTTLKPQSSGDDNSPTPPSPSPSPSPKLFLPRDPPTTAKCKFQARTAPATPVIEIIDLTSDDEAEYKFVPQVQQSHTIPKSESTLELQHSTATKEESTTAQPSSTRSIFTHPAETLPSKLEADIKKYSDLNATDHQRVSPYQITQVPRDSTKLLSFNQEWVAQFRQRQRDKYRSPTRQTARRSPPPISKARKAKRPIMKAKISRGKRERRVVRVRDVYDDYEIQKTDIFKRVESHVTAKNRSLPSFAEVTIEDIRDFDKNDREFEKAFANTCDQVLSDQTENILVEPKLFEIPSWMIDSQSTTSTRGNSVGLQRKERPTFLKPLSDLVYIALGPNIFPIYRDFLEYHSPVFSRACTQARNRPVTPEPIKDVDLDVFGLFIQWLYTQSLLNKHDQPAYQHRLMGLWVLGRKLQMPTMQNDAIDMLDARRELEKTIQIKSLDYVYKNTIVGDGLRRYLVDVCVPVMHTFSPKMVKDFFPKEFLEELTEAQFVKLENREKKMGMETERDMSRYHVVEEDLTHMG